MRDFPGDCPTPTCILVWPLRVPPPPPYSYLSDDHIESASRALEGELLYKTLLFICVHSEYYIFVYRAVKKTVLNDNDLLESLKAQTETEGMFCLIFIDNKLFYFYVRTLTIAYTGFLDKDSKKQHKGT